MRVRFYRGSLFTSRTCSDSGMPALIHQTVFRFAIICFLVFAGCSQYGVREFDTNEQAQILSQNATNSDRMSHGTRRFLGSENFRQDCEDEPVVCLLDIDTLVRTRKDRTMVVFAAELAYYTARNYPEDSQTFARLNASALVYATAALFDSKLSGNFQEYDPHEHLSVQIYNRSLAQLIRYFKTRRTMTSATIRLPLLRGSLHLTIEKDPTVFLPVSFLHTAPAYDYKAVGFANHQSFSGLGTPLILIRRYPKDALDSLTVQDSYQFLGKSDQAYPATAVFEDSLNYFHRDKGAYRGKLRILNSLAKQSAEVYGRTIPLEADLTSPMAYMLSGAEESDSFFRRLDGDAISQSRGLYMLHPYDEDKIPIVFVHGLASSPMTWFPMINELLGDKEIRENYQFWVYWYPTSNPVVVSAAQMRDDLNRAGSEFQFSSMVLAGHSMGGLLSRLMIQTSTATDWIEASGIDPRRLEELDPETKHVVERITSYEPLPYVKRVIFLATPHRGSLLADGLAGYLGRQILSVPTGVAGFVKRSLYALAGEDSDAVGITAPTGIDSLSPGGLFVKVTMKQKFADVPYHSIIGSRRSTDLDWVTDSVVPYASSHLPGAASELVVESDHSVQLTMPAILEVRRILKEHLSSEK